MSLLDAYRLFLVDIDDTVYLERDYVISGLGAVASHLAQDTGLPQPHLRTFLVERFLRTGRDRILDACLDHFGLDASPARIESLVSIYRHHRPHIALLPGVAGVLDAMVKRGSILFVTDGIPVMQRNKFSALSLDKWSNLCFYCWEHGQPKPETGTLEAHLQSFEGPALMIGDNPGHDLCMASRMGIDAVRVRQGRFAALDSWPYRPLCEVGELRALVDA